MEPQQDIKHYWRIFLARKWYFIIPVVLATLAAGVAAVVWPPVYEAKSTILIEEQQIPPDFVRTTVTGFAEQRIQSISQHILSRTRLVEIIHQFDLYAQLRQKAPMETVVERMRRDISVETISAEVGDGRRRTRGGQQGGMTIAFTVAYRGSNQDQVLKVASTLASLYLQENLKIREQQAKSTTQFLEAELKEIQERIRGLGEKISEFKVKNEGMLPEMYNFNLSQAERLEREIEQLNIQIRAAEDRRIYLEGLLTTIRPEMPIGTPGERPHDPHTRLKFLQVALVDLTSRYSPEHPDVMKVKREIAELEKLVENSGTSPELKRQKLAQLRGELAQKQGRYGSDHPEIIKLKKEITELEKLPEAVGPPQVAQSDNPSYITLSSNLHATLSDIASLKQQRADAERKLRVYRERLERIPQGEQEYLALVRDYQNAHAKHQEIMNKILEARIAEGMEEAQKAERFTLIDPAVYPEKPVAPNRFNILLVGMLLGFAGGVGLVLLSENLDHSIKSATELAWLSGLPVLARINRIITPEDRLRQLRRRRLVLTAAGLSLMLGLAAFHWFIMDLWIFTARLGRLLGRYI